MEMSVERFESQMVAPKSNPDCLVDVVSIAPTRATTAATAKLNAQPLPSMPRLAPSSSSAATSTLRIAPSSPTVVLTPNRQQLNSIATIHDSPAPATSAPIAAATTKPSIRSSPSSTSYDDNQKRYLCQRCLNHRLEFPRKGHKPYCRYAHCQCEDCMMVERRRQLNNQLSARRLDPNAPRAEPGSKKVRDPKCARCSAHGMQQALRGHKRSLCPFGACECHLCMLVENRRTLMARQIKLRRDQQKARRAQRALDDTEDDVRRTVDLDLHTPQRNGNSATPTTTTTPSVRLPSKRRRPVQIREPPLQSSREATAANTNLQLEATSHRDARRVDVANNNAATTMPNCRPLNQGAHVTTNANVAAAAEQSPLQPARSEEEIAAENALAASYMSPSAVAAAAAAAAAANANALEFFEQQLKAQSNDVFHSHFGAAAAMPYFCAQYQQQLAAAVAAATAAAAVTSTSTSTNSPISSPPASATTSASMTMMRPPTFDTLSGTPATTTTQGNGAHLPSVFNFDAAAAANVASSAQQQLYDLFSLQLANAAAAATVNSSPTFAAMPPHVTPTSLLPPSAPPSSVSSLSMLQARGLAALPSLAVSHSPPTVAPPSFLTAAALHAAPPPSLTGVESLAQQQEPSVITVSTTLLRHLLEVAAEKQK